MRSGIALAEHKAMADAAESKCQLLQWDSGFFGFPVGRVVGSSIESSDGDAIDHWARANGVRCVYFLAEPGPTVASVAESIGFHLVDIRQTFDIDLRRIAGARERPECVRKATPEDANRVYAAALQCEFSTRFTADRCFPGEKVREMYARWAARLVEGEDSAVFMVQDSDGVQGFATVSGLVADGCAKLDLIGVLPRGRRTGLGRRLVGAVIDSAVRAGAKRLTVVTQGWNIAAQRLYQSLGFRTCDCALWFHKWYDGSGHAA